MNRLLRKILVVCQFSISITLIISTIGLFKQINHLKNMDLGYDKKNLVCIHLNKQIKTKYEIYKTKLLNHPDIINVTATLNLPTWANPSTYLSDWEGNEDEKEIIIHHCSVDYDFFETFKMKILQGRSFSAKHPTDRISGFIVNEKALSQMGLKDPIGKRLNTLNKRGEIIGVVKDYNFNLARSKIEPMILELDPYETEYIIIRVTDTKNSDVLEYINNCWNELNTDYPCNYNKCSNTASD